MSPDSTDEEDKTGVNGTMRYLQDLGLNLESAEILVPLEIVQAPALAEMSKDAFVEGWKAIGFVFLVFRSELCLLNISVPIRSQSNRPTSLVNSSNYLLTWHCLRECTDTHSFAQENQARKPFRLRMPSCIGR